MIVEVKRDEKVYKQTYSKGHPTSKLKVVGSCKKKEHGTTITFRPDATIFDEGTRFRPYRLYNQAKSKAYLFKGVEIRWKCADVLIEKAN